MKFFAIFLLLMEGVSGASERPQDFSYGMAIEADSKGALYEIEIPAAVYRGVTRGDLGDLRVFNGQGEVVPHAFRPRLGITQQTGAAVRLPVFPLYGKAMGEIGNLKVRVHKRADGTIIDVQNRAKDGAETKLRGYLLDASILTRSLSALEFDWQSTGNSFLGQVRIEGSNDLTHWWVLADNPALARLDFGGQQVKRNRVGLRSAQVKYLRLSWPDDQPPLEALTVLAEPSPLVVESPRLWQRFVGAPVAGKSGEYSYDLGGAVVFDRLRVQLPQVNTLVQVRFLSRGKPSDEWRPVTTTLAFRLRERNAEVTSPEIFVASRGERYWLARVDPKGGGVGSGAMDIEIGWVPHKLVFAARGAGPFQLAYGNSRVKPAAFAIESLIPRYKTDAEFKVKLATLGEQFTLAGPAQWRDPWDYRKLTLWSSLIVGVGLLGWMAMRLSRQMVKPPVQSRNTDDAN